MCMHAAANCTHMNHSCMSAHMRMRMPMHMPVRGSVHTSTHMSTHMSIHRWDDCYDRRLTKEAEAVRRTAAPQHSAPLTHYTAL